MSDLSIIPECYVDTILIETLVPPQHGYNHQHGCGTVSNRMKEKLADTFALGIIDKDKKELDYLNEFDKIKQSGSLYLFKHKNKHHYLIQISPAIERFILDNAAACGIRMSDYELPASLSELTAVSKKTRSKKDHRFKRLFRDIQSKGSPGFMVLTNWIFYLKTRTYEVNRDELTEL